MSTCIVGASWSATVRLCLEVWMFPSLTALVDSVAPVN